MEDVPWIFIAQPNFRIAMREDVEGYCYRNTEFTWWWELYKTSWE